MKNTRTIKYFYVEYTRDVNSNEWNRHDRAFKTLEEARKFTSDNEGGFTFRYAEVEKTTTIHDK